MPRTRLALLGACCLLALAPAHALADEDPGVGPATIGDVEESAPDPPAVIVPQPSMGQITGLPLSSLAAPARVSIEVRSGSVIKSIGANGWTSLPVGQGLVEAEVRFPFPVDAGTTAVRLQAPDTATSWQVERRRTSTADSISFNLRGSSPADLLVEVQSPHPATGARFRLRLTPALVIEPGDAEHTAQVPVGQQFMLHLPDGYTWTVDVDDPTVVSEMAGTPGGYQALQAGTTTLNVSGDPACYHSGRGCLLPSFNFQVHIIVTAGPNG